MVVKKNGKRHGYWALVESYRTSRGPRQRVVNMLPLTPFDLTEISHGFLAFLRYS